MAAGLSMPLVGLQLGLQVDASGARHEKEPNL